MIRAILFDLDGVLIDSLENAYLAYNSMLKHFGKKELIFKRFLDEFWGWDVNSHIKMSFGNVSKEKIKETSDFFHKKRLEFLEHTKLYPDNMQVLEKLKKNFRLGVITSTFTSITYKILEYFDIKKYFEVIICGDMIEKTKPAPDAIFKACNELKIKPKEAIYVGDNFRDVEAGKKAKCFTVAITTTSSREELKDADKIIDNLNELIKVIE